jgi:hypothetical protein
MADAGVELHLLHPDALWLLRHERMFAPIAA